jgi:opacity protein-like surface antigen
MKKVLVVAVAAVLAAGALAADFVREGFDRSTFPPAGWKVETNGYGSGAWRREGYGPWGAHAVGMVSSVGSEDPWAELWTYEFSIPARTEIYYGFYYWALGGGNYGCVFHIGYVSAPGGYLVKHRPLGNTNWKYVSGHAFNLSAARVKARWSVSCGPSAGTSGVVLGIDRVTITDEDPHAVAPTSLGRVKALFR